jgi:hypothetical protein
MSIKMQGLWLVKVKAKNAARAQKFKIQGAGPGMDGIYTGEVATPEIVVNGNDWAITILADSSSGFVPSVMQIKFPTENAGFYQFEIESNDGGNDQDFNDLILTCRTPKDPNDYIVYGNVSYYEGNCFFNPCRRRELVIDTITGLHQLIKNPAVKDLVKKYYPERVRELERVALNPQPLPPSPGDPFVPMIVPLADDIAIPEKQKILVQSRADILKIAGEKKGTETEIPFRSMISAQRVNTSGTSPLIAAVTNDKLRIDAIHIIDRYRFYCTSAPLPDAILRFNEYDRSAGELSGEAYSGNGDRQILGGSFTDRNGNYIFRFKTTALDVLDEQQDTPSGGDSSLQIAPDVLIQLMCPGTNVPAFETAPLWNVGHLTKINICIPKSNSCLVPLPCDGQHIIQGVGNVVLGPENVSGTRTGANNFLNTIGIITAYGEGAPAARCAAWRGTLQLRGCLKDKAIKYYKIEYRTNSSGSSFGPYTQQFELPRFDGPNVINQPVFDTVNNVYINAETDTTYAWLPAYKNIKARIYTGSFANGSYIFKITGLNTTFGAVTSEEVRLYFDNGAVTAAIDPEILMSGVGILGECALFTLPVDSNGNPINTAPITVKFKVIHNAGSPTGFISDYGLSMAKGAGGFAFTPGAAPANFVLPGLLDNVINSGRVYAHTSDLNCITNFRGTVNETTADSNGYYSVTINPGAGGWLEADQKFCAFGIYLGGHVRVTNGEGGYPYFSGGQVLIGIQKP